MNWLGVRPLVLTVRQRLWMAALTFGLVAVVALVRYAGPGSAARQSYLASQALTVRVLPADAGGTYAQASATQLSARIARQLSSEETLASPTFTRAVVQQVVADHPAIMSRFGADAALTLSALDPRAVGAAFSARHTAGGVTITARWPSAAGAWALATAAGERLEADAASSAGVSVSPADGATLRIQREGASSAPAPDPAPANAALVRLLETLLLGLIGGVVVAAVVGQWERWRGASGASYASPVDGQQPQPAAANRDT